MSRLLLPVLTLVLLAYPFGVYFGLQYWQPKTIGLVLLLALWARYLVACAGHSNTSTMPSLLMITIVSGGLCFFALLFNRVELIRLNPVVINLVLLVVFAYTLYNPPSMIERFARRLSPDLPTTAITYTRNVTRVWCGFFAVNASIAFYTCFFTSLAVWTLYNGLIAYFLMGLLFIFEYLYRRFRLRVRS